MLLRKAHVLEDNKSLNEGCPHGIRDDILFHCCFILLIELGEVGLQGGGRSLFDGCMQQIYSKIRKVEFMCTWHWGSKAKVKQASKPTFTVQLHENHNTWCIKVFNTKDYSEKPQSSLHCNDIHVKQGQTKCSAAFKLKEATVIRTDATGLIKSVSRDESRRRSSISGKTRTGLRGM